MTNGRRTYLVRLCEVGIEACWLAAVVAAPLFFNVYSHRVFEPDKVTILRLLAVVMGFAWVVRTVERRGSGRRAAIAPMALAALLVLLVSVGATVLSVAPHISLWGSYNRVQGLYTTAAYVGVFLSVVGLLRTREQIERLISTALLTSLPVSLYGIIQYFGTDPLRWGADVTERVTSTMGNPIFVAAFLILTVPLTLYRLLVTGDVAVKNEWTATKRVLVVGGLASLAFQMIAWLSGPIAGTASAAITIGTWVAVSLLLDRPLVPFLRIGCYTVLLSAQLMCILFSQSRGPWLGLAGGLFLFALLWTLVQGSRRRAYAVIGRGLVLASAVVALNWPGSPLGFVRDIPYVGRVGQLTKTESGSGRVRVLIWEGVTELIAEDPAQALIGYGPETMNLVHPPHYRPELGRIQADAAADRSHNETFDVVVTTGFVGFAVYLLFMTGLFHSGLRRIGLLQTRVRSHVFLWLWFAGGGAGVAAARLLDGGWRFSGIALPIGMFAGLLVFLFGCAVGRTTEQKASDGEIDSGRLLAVTTLAIVTAHFLEIQIGLAIVPTRTYFWVFAAVMVACSVIRPTARPPVHQAELVPGLTTSARPLSNPSLTVASLVVGMILLTLIYDFYLPAAGVSRAGPVWWLLAFSWVFGGLAVITETWPDHRPMRDRRSWSRAFFVYSLVTLATALPFAMIHGSLLRLGVDGHNLIYGYVAAMLLLVVVTGSAMIPKEETADRFRDRRLVPAYLLLAVGVAFAVNTNLDVVRADVHFRKASDSLKLGRHAEAVAELRRAVHLEPKQDAYYLFLGKGLLDHARANGGADSLMQEAERALLKARELSPLDPNHTANLARLYHAWANEEEPGTTRDERLRKSLSLFERATTLSPNRPRLWNEQARVYLSVGDTLEARRMYEHSLELDSRLLETRLLVGDLHFAQKRWRDAVSSYEEALRLKPGLALVQLRLAVAKARLER